MLLATKTLLWAPRAPNQYPPPANEASLYTDETKAPLPPGRSRRGREAGQPSCWREAPSEAERPTENSG